MDNIAKKECQNDVINLLQEKEYNEDGVRMFFRNFVNIEVEEQLKDEVNKYKEKQKRRIFDVYNAFNEDTPNEIKKIKGVPIQKYDHEKKQPYLEYPNGRRKYA